MQHDLSDNVQIIPFKPKHYPLLTSMLSDQKYEGLEFISKDTLPKIGYIALLGTQPVAAGFLRRVEGNFGQLDTFASNPKFGSKIRHIGISKVVESLMIECKELELSGIIALTGDLGIIIRAKELGFQILNQTVIGLKLK